MRITIILGPFYPVPPVLGGAVEKVHLLLAGAYRAAGHEVTIISRRYKGFPNEEIINGIRHLRISSTDRFSSLALNLVLDFFYALRVSRTLPQSDVTVTNSFFTPLFLRRRTAGKIYVHVARYPKRQMFLYSRADRLQAISRAVAAAIIRESPHLSEKVVSIGYPIHDGFFCSAPVQPRTKTILFVGRIAREKGVHLLIKSFASMMKNGNPRTISEWTLRIVGPHEVSQGGDGPDYFNELRELAQELGPACKFIGPIFAQQELIDEYKAASIFVYPSLAEAGEALGLAPLEAMAAGCAVIVSNLCCFDDYAEEGISALKFDHQCTNPDAKLAIKLGQFIGEPRLIEEIANNGNKVANRFRLPIIAGKMLEDFESLVKAG
jgi:glycosyltransferase involved in cell wall biosynthesis